MIRALVGLVVVILAIVVAVFFADRPGAVSIVWQGWRIETSVAVAVLALAVALALAFFLLRLVLRVVAAPAGVIRRRREARRLRGYRELTLGLVAIAAGDGKEAERQRRRAELSFRKGRLGTPPLAQLLAAQTALLQGDAVAAKAGFDALLDDPETAFLGLRGLIVQALKSGDDATALALTERAKRLKPKSAWVLQSQLALEARTGDWRRAAETLRLAVKRHALPAETGKRYRTALLVARSRQAVGDGRTNDALTYAAEAHGLDDGFAPAAIHYATLLSERERLAKGLRVLETAWAKSGHPQIAETYDRLLAAEAPIQRLRRVDRLLDIRPSDREGHLAAAAVALSARLWGETRRHLDQAGAQGPGPWPARLCHLAAELAESEHQDAQAARQWRDRAARAPADPVWTCGACGAETLHWEAICPSCQGFATLAWRVPDRAAAQRVVVPTAIIPPQTETLPAVPAPPGAADPG